MKHIIWTPLFAAALSLWSCSQAIDDAPGTVNPDAGTPAATGYLGIRLQDVETKSRATDNGTHQEYDDDYVRFEWFNKGTADERAIIENPGCNRVLFFNRDGSYFGSYGLEKPSVKMKASNIYVAQTPLEADDIAYAMVVLNADADRMAALDLILQSQGSSAVTTVLNYINKLDENPESLAMAADEDGKKYFTMSSTTYRKEDADEVTVLTELDPEGPIFYETEEEALQPENLTTFYVERLLAKFTLILRDKMDGNKRFSEYTAPILVDGVNKLKVRMHYALSEGEEDDAKDIMSDWKINLVNWGLNGLEKNTYLLKRLVENPGPSYPEDWRITENFYTGWNAPTLFRSYWSLDEHYSDGIYPDQYRQALDMEGVTAATTNTIYSEDFEGLIPDDYTLIYKPYNAYTDQTENKYSPENTFNPSVLSDKDLSSQPWLRCGTHIILTAQFIIDAIDKNLKMDKAGFMEGVSDKYFSNGMYWSEKALKEQAVATLMTNIYYNKASLPIPNVLGEGNVEFINTAEHTLDDQIPVAVVENGKIIPLTHEKLEENADKYFEFAPAFIKGGDGWVTLKKKDGVILKARYVSKAGDIELGDISDEQLVSYIYRFTNLAKHFKEGRMYYALPIRHNLNSMSFETSPVTAVRTGDYGVVRNTWYRLTITSIQRPGTPVDDPDQPIIPNPEPDDKSLGVEVEIIPWRTVNIDVDQLY